MKNSLFWIIFILVFGAWLYTFTLYIGPLDFGLVLLALFSAVCTLLIFGCIKRIVWRVENGVDLFATLETDPEELKAKMLASMRVGRVKDTLMELGEIFRNYPQWELQNWEVFRAWYKDVINRGLIFPEFYERYMEDCLPYDKDNDPLYDPEAPDWEQFAWKRYYDDDDDDDDDDDFSDSSRNDRDTASDWIYGGVGFELGSSILSGDSGSDNSDADNT